MSFVVDVKQYPAAMIAAGSAKTVGEELKKLGAAVSQTIFAHTASMRERERQWTPCSSKAKET